MGWLSQAWWLSASEEARYASLECFAGHLYKGDLGGEQLPGFRRQLGNLILSGASTIVTSTDPLSALALISSGDLLKTGWQRFMASDEWTTKIAEIEIRMRQYHEHFAPYVKRLRAEIRRAGKYDIGLYIGGGRSAFAYHVDIDGTGHVIKLARDQQIDTLCEALALRSTVGMPRVQQLTAYSAYENVVISPLLPGKGICKMTPNDLWMISDMAVRGLIDTAIELFNRGVAIDPAPNNYRLAPDGYQVLDMSLKQDNATLEFQVLSLLLAVTYPAISWRSEGNPGHVARSDELLAEAEIALLFASIVAAHYPDIVERYLRHVAEHGESGAYFAKHNIHSHLNRRVAEIWANVEALGFPMRHRSITAMER